MSSVLPLPGALAPHLYTPPDEPPDAPQGAAAIDPALLDPRRETRFRPRTPGKLAVLMLRASLRLPLFHPHDAEVGAREGHTPGRGAGNEFGEDLVRELSDGGLEVAGPGPRSQQGRRVRRAGRWRARDAA